MGTFATKNNRINFRSTEIEHLKATKGASVLEYKDLTFVMWGDDAKQKVSIKAWKGNAAKPFAFYGWTIKSDDLTPVNEWVGKQKEWADRLDGYKQERKAANTAGHSLEIGDIVYTSWGYEQTNVDFFQVTATPSKCYVEVREIATEHIESTSYCSSRVKPKKDEFVGEPARKMAKGTRVISCCRYGYDGSKYTSGDRGVHCSWGY